MLRRGLNIAKVQLFIITGKGVATHFCIFINVSHIIFGRLRNYEYFCTIKILSLKTHYFYEDFTH
jgi:hypothetical protein